VNAFILAGGQSKRMGRDKALLGFRGQPLIEYAVAKLRSLGFSPRIAGSRSDLGKYAPVIVDNYPGLGPLAGIEAALIGSDTDLNLFLPVDLPLLPGEFIVWMIARADRTCALATIPHLQGRPQPLCAVYHRGLMPFARSALDAKDGKVMRAVEKAVQATKSKLDIFDIEAVSASIKFSPDRPGEWPMTPAVHLWFQNLNTPADLEIAALEESQYIQ
jgi:molybdenum cofactor guanylyltransferase